MANSLLTKCPFCQTLFRIQYDQLAVAEGEVRCGVCLKVFNAKAQGISFSQGSDLGPEVQVGTNLKPLTESESVDRPGADEKEAAKEMAEQPDNAAPTTPTASPTLDQIAELTIHQEPAEQLLVSNQSSRTADQLKWTLLSLLAATLAAGQWLWFNMNQYALDPKWRPGYEAGCRILGCELPGYSDPKLITTEQLAVRSHPQYTNVLTVDLVISNQAAFSQTLPVLEMEFYNIDGQAMAQRRFQPLDYLPATNNSLKSMPSQVPVHLSFSIIDPGVDAVNYGLQISK